MSTVGILFIVPMRTGGGRKLMQWTEARVKLANDVTYKR